MEKLGDSIQVEASAIASASEEQARFATWVVIATGAAALLAAIIVAFSLDRKIARPLSDATATLRSSTL